MNQKQTFTPNLSKRGNPIMRHTDTLMTKAAAHAVVPEGDGDFHVFSTSGEVYAVTLTQTDQVMEGATRPTIFATCTCDYGLAHESQGHCTCSHTIAAVRAAIGRPIKVYGEPPTGERRPHRPVAYLGDGVWAAI